MRLPGLLIVPLLVYVAFASGCATQQASLPPAARTPDYGIAIVPEHEAPGWRLCRNCTAPHVSPKTPVLPTPVAAVALDPLASPIAGARLEEVELSAALFAHDSALLTPEARAAIKAIATRARALLADGKQFTIVIHGYTDNTGTLEVNAPLAQARADAVAARMRHDLVGVEITATGRPLCCYVAHNRSPAGRAANRRVTVALHAALPTPDVGEEIE